MIDSVWLNRVACPVCLEPKGCDRCSTTGGHEACEQGYAERVLCACGGPDKRALEHRGEGLLCPCCLTRYRFGPNRDYVDLLPKTGVGRVSHYADEEFQERLGVREGPPVLSAGIKARMVERMLGGLSRGEALVDFGSGAGKFATHFARRGASVCGVDMAPFFLQSAISGVSLVAGDLRRLPLRKGVASKGYTLDVLEHVDETGVREILTEARRALVPGGKLFVYTHAMESSKIASFQRAVNRVAKGLGKVGLVDSEKEAMRKEDHVNAIRSHEHFDALAAGAGLRVVDRRYYNVVVKAVVEDLVLKVIQQAQSRRAAPERGGADARPGAPSSHVVGRPAPGPVASFVARALTGALALDLALFGRVRTGPFFGLLETRA